MSEKKTEKEENNSENLVQGLDQLRFVVKANATNLLFHGKSPKYPSRFQSWAKNTQGEHLENLVDAFLSGIAYPMATGRATHFAPNVDVEYLRGMAQGVLLFQEFIKIHASETKPSDDTEQDEFGFNG